MVSSNEELIIVDENDNVIGYRDKESCHNGRGILHRAFSIFIFNSRNELLLQRRSRYKRLWPLFWSNSCCGHPREGEKYIVAAKRRLKEELGIEAKLECLFRFQYQAMYENIGTENELCSVYVGKSDELPNINKEEIREWKYISIEKLSKELKEQSDHYTPWFKIEWQHILKRFMNKMKTLET